MTKEQIILEFSKQETSIYEPITVRTSPQAVIDAFKEKYVKEFGKMDDRAYFIAGFLLETFDELFNHPSDKRIKNEA